jgi:hypothetical protein
LVGFHGFSWFVFGFHVFQGSLMVFHGFLLVSMVFQGSFMVFGWFPWFFKVVSWFLSFDKPRKSRSGIFFPKVNIVPKSIHPRMHPPELNSDPTIPF